MNLTKDHIASGKLYHDDGNGFGYRNDDYAMYEFSASSDKKNKATVAVKRLERKKK